MNNNSQYSNKTYADTIIFLKTIRTTLAEYISIKYNEV